MKHDKQAVRLSDYRPPAYRIERVELDFLLDPTATRVIARMELRSGDGEAAGEPLVLDGDELTLKRIAIDGTDLGKADYEATPDRLTIHRPPDDSFSLVIETEVNPTANTQLMGLYRTGRAYCTQCEAEGFRRIIYFLDRPDVLSVFTTRIEADKTEAPVLLGNGNPVESGDVPGSSRHFAVWHDPFPKPCYLFALVAGDLACVPDSFRTMSGREVELGIYCEPGKEARCRHAMAALKRSMAWDETVFGREYDLDVFNIVAVSDFNMGAMENKGLNVFNDRYVLADADSATDDDYANIESVIAHEYFHNWTGNRITCRDWFQLCLKEGLTVFRDQEYSADLRSRPVERIGDVRTLQARQFAEDAGPLAHPVRPELYHEINNFYTATVYEKGAELVRMLKVIVGDHGFRAGMDLYFERHDGDAATVEDFIACFADATGTALDQFLTWYSQAGTPEVRAEGAWDGDAKTYRLALSQTTPPTPGQPTKAPLHIPLRFGLIGPNGEDLDIGDVEGGAVDGDVLHLTDAAQEVVFNGVSARPVLSLGRGFSAPVKLETNQTEQDRLFALKHDSDPFNRWQAAQRLALGQFLAATEAAATGRETAPEVWFVDALIDVAETDTLEPAFRAQILQLPSEADIAREIGKNVDPDAIAAGRGAVRLAIGQTASARLAAVRDSVPTARPYSADADEAGKRALRNAALDLMAAGRSTEAIGLVSAQYDDADNMTDRTAALAILCRGAFAERRPVLDDFATRYRGDPLVLDKWLAMEAITPAPEALDRVVELLDHPAFSITNPNRVRALVGSFASANQTQFNRADGRGYEMVADFVLRLDPNNPQTAARLLLAFRSWRALEPGRREKAESALKRIDATASLSADVRDIVSRSLA